jgi:hypothetical protein
VPVTAPAGVAELVRRRLAGTYEVDEWGLDPDLLVVAERLAGLRWSIEVEGAGSVPPEGPAVVVASRRVGISEPLVLAAALRRATGRAVRFLGLPDVPVVGPALRRVGSAVERPEELAGLLRAGGLVSLHLGRKLRRGRAGRLVPELLAPVPAAVPVLPAAVVGRELGRSWRVVVGPPVEVAPAATPEARSEAVRQGVARLLEPARPRG